LPELDAIVVVDLAEAIERRADDRLVEALDAVPARLGEQIPAICSRTNWS